MLNYKTFKYKNINVKIKKRGEVNREFMTDRDYKNQVFKARLPLNINGLINDMIVLIQH